MIEIRTQFSVAREGLEVFVLRRDYEGKAVFSLTQQYRNIAPEVEKTWWAWEEVEGGAHMLPTFFLPMDSVPKLIEDLNRDNMGVKEGAESSVQAHKDDLKEILDKVLPHALRDATVW